ncbi:hypothetical protein AALA24_13590 [Anaerovoracaceae bacterium 42-11]
MEKKHIVKNENPSKPLEKEGRIESWDDFIANLKLDEKILKMAREYDACMKKKKRIMAIKHMLFTAMILIKKNP